MLDNSGGHFDLNLSGFTVEFLSKNSTSTYQQLDMCIIAQSKRRYCSKLLRKTIDIMLHMENPGNGFKRNSACGRWGLREDQLPNPIPQDEPLKLSAGCAFARFSPQPNTRITRLMDDIYGLTSVAELHMMPISPLIAEIRVKDGLNDVEIQALFDVRLCSSLGSFYEGS
eukprot:IDg14037t1